MRRKAKRMHERLTKNQMISRLPKDLAAKLERLMAPAHPDDDDDVLKTIASCPITQADIDAYFRLCP